jgi:hypothetical protein
MKMNTSLATKTLATLCVTFSIASAAAQSTISLVTSKDTTLYESNSGSLANGGGSSFFVGRVGLNGGYKIRRGMLQWDIAGSIPAGSRILAAELDMYSAQSSAFLPINTDVHRILQNWSEGNRVAPGAGGAGGSATSGESTWIHRNYPSQTWNNPGGDFDPTPSYTFSLPGVGFLVTPPFAGLVADVQDWLDNPSSNYGWLLKTPELVAPNARRIHSREASNFQPKLNITYLAPGQTGTYGTGWPVGSGTFQLSISGTATGGNTLPITYTNAPSPSIGVNFFSLALNPIGTELLPNCFAYLPLNGVIISGSSFITSGGTGVSSFTVPSGSPGFLLNVQAAVLDATPLSFSLSNSGVMLTQ